MAIAKDVLRRMVWEFDEQGRFVDMRATRQIITYDGTGKVLALGPTKEGPCGFEQIEPADPIQPKSF